MSVLHRAAWSIVPVVLTLLLGQVLATPVLAADDGAPPLVTEACAEPAGQTDTPSRPRLRRLRIDDVAVAVVLPPGYSTTTRRYPVVYLLHGAQGDEDSWIEYGGLLTDTARRPADQQAIVVMPRMGTVTGLATDWVDGHRHDATLIGRDLVRRVDARFRTLSGRRHRAVAGYSGGGLSATHLAQRFPRVFGQLGVLSAPVDLRNPGGIAATYAAFQAEKVCAGDDALAAGPLGDPVTHAAAWEAVDPLAQAGRLRRTSVFLSSGNGNPCQASDLAALAVPTAATEPQIRTQMNAFSAALDRAGVRHVHQQRPCGLHWWTTWRPALGDFWSAAARVWARR